MSNQELASFIWTVADLLRGDFKQHEYGDVILPLTILRRLDCVLSKNKDKVLSEYKKHESKAEEMREKFLNKASGLSFHNYSPYDFDKLVADPNNLADNLKQYIASFSSDIRDVMEKFKFEEVINSLEDKDLLFQVSKRFSEIDLSPKRVTSMSMGYVFEELIRKFAEASNDTAGEHFTPREVIRLMVNLLFNEDKEALTQDGVVRTIYDCACGTGGMLSVAEEYVADLNEKARIEVFGQELNDQSYAICKSDMMIKGQKASNIKQGNTLSDDQHQGATFDYMLANPPFGVEWKKIKKTIDDEHKSQGFGGRFGAGTPKISDGSLLFLQHLISKMKQDDKGSKIAIVFNGSPLFSGQAGSGESEIRRWILENDMLEAIVALPDQLFYNTGISTYIWLVNNKKSDKRKGKVQLINASNYFHKMSKSLGSKRKEIGDDDISEITRIYGEFSESKESKIFNNSDFGYARVVVERPQVEDGVVVTDKKGKPKADSKLRDNENIPLSVGSLEASKKEIEAYMDAEVRPHIEDAWVDYSKTKIGYEINFTRYFYEYKPLRSLEDIKADILALEEEIQGGLEEVLV